MNKYFYVLIYGLFYGFFIKEGFCSDSSIWHVPSINRFFIGRDDVIQEIDNRFNRNNENIIALTGIGGIGKTQIVKKYAQLHLQEYDFVWWFDASKDLFAQFYQLGNQWRSSFSQDIPLERLSQEGLVTFIKNVLNATEKKWLLIFDNVNDYDSIEKYLPSIPFGNKKILITSRNANKWPDQIAVSELSEVESVKLLEILGNIEMASKEDLKKIAKILNKHPLSLIQAAALIKHKKLSPKGYLTLYQKENFYQWFKNKFPLKMSDFTDGYKDVDLASLDISLSQLEKENAKAYELLGILSLLNHRKISQNYMEKISLLLGKNDKKNLENLLIVLKNFSFVEESWENEKVYFSMHDIVQSFIKNRFSEHHKKDFIKKLIQIFKPEFSHNWHLLVEEFRKNPELFDHLKALEKDGEELREALPDLVDLKIAILENHMYHTRQHMAYESLFKEIEKLINQIGEFVLDPFSVARFKIDKVYIRETYDSLEKTQELETQFEEAIKYFQQDEGKKEELLRAYTNKAQCLIFQGKSKEALDVMNNAEKLYRQVRSNGYKLLFLYVKAWVLSEIGNFQEGQEVVNRYTPLLERETNVPIRLHALNMKANILMHVGKEEEAFKSACQSYEASETYYLSNENEICAESSMVMAAYYRYKGELQKARQAIERSIDIYSRYFGGDGRHQDQGFAYALYGDILDKMGESSKALEAYQTSERIYLHLFKDNIGESEFLGELFKKIAILGVRLHDNNIPRHYLSLIGKYFGNGSRFTTEILKCLDEEGLCLP